MKLARLNDSAEIFYSIQGEGTTAGKPAVFIRLSLCNLSCVWCDTDYTWNFEGTAFKHIYDAMPGYKKHLKEDVIIELSPTEVAKQALLYPCRHFVLTGGEPLLQQADLTELATLLKQQGGAGTWLEMETNGTLIPDEKLNNIIDRYHVSPKLKSSGNRDNARIHSEALQYFADNDKAWFKFVSDNNEDNAEILEMITKYALPRHRCIVMPQGTSALSLSQKLPAVADFCLMEGLMLGNRLHVHIWGDKRGV